MDNVTSNTLTNCLLGLYRHISQRRRRQFYLLVCLMIIASFAEVISIAAILPFLGLLTQPQKVFDHPLSRPFIEYLQISSASELLLPITVCFGFAILFSGSVRLLLIWASTRLSFAVGADLSIDIYRRTLHQPYAVHVTRNSSEIISGISTKTNSVISYIITPVLTLFSSFVIMLSILIILLVVNPGIAITAFSVFGIIYLCIFRITRNKLAVDSRRIAVESTEVIRALQEGLGGIRDVLLDGTQSVYCQSYRNADLPLRRAQGNAVFISQSPRYAMEALGMLAIVIFAYSLAATSEGVSSAIPVLGSLALGAQRLLPVLQQAYSAWSNIWAGQASLKDTLVLLDQKMPEEDAKQGLTYLNFEKALDREGVFFKYHQDAPWVFESMNLTIKKGSRVGVLGRTGGGKSTLIDLVMGLLSPTCGSMKIDGVVVTDANRRLWQKRIAHVPQSIFLTDGSIEENIALGVLKTEVDHQRVRRAAEQAQISEMIEKLPLNYQTQVGERGVRLSGGQRQRIGIARALYKQADVIIFDEATSALDSSTERAVMEAIESLSADLTIIIIAHRITTLKNCTEVVEVGESGILQSGTYEDVLAAYS